MIRLLVDDYCHDCPDFEARVNKINDDDGHICSTNIYCEHEERCEAIYKHIKDELKKGQKR